MTSGRESSDRARGPSRPAQIESFAGVFHPHAIEVQDFSHYALVIDVRTWEEYEDDHIPNAVQFSPAVVNQGPLVLGVSDDRSRALVARNSASDGELPTALAALVSPLKLDQAVLLYCGRGGLHSLPVARPLRWPHDPGFPACALADQQAALEGESRSQATVGNAQLHVQALESGVDRALADV